MDTTNELRLICGHDSHDVDGCVTCEAATLIESLRQQLASRDAEVERYASALLHVRKALCGDIHNTEDILDLVESLNKERDQLREKVKVLQAGVLAVNCLIADSYGVAGLHMNGDIAEWNSLRIGGQFESWLIEFDEALAATEPKP